MSAWRQESAPAKVLLRRRPPPDIFPLRNSRHLPVPPTIDRQAGSLNQEVVSARAHHSLLGVGVEAVVTRAIDIEVAVGARGTVPEVVEELNGEVMGAAAPVTLQEKLVGLTRGMQGMRGLGATDLLAIDEQVIPRIA